MSLPTHEAGPAAAPEYPYGYPAPVQPPQGKNGFAVAALVFGLIGGILFGLGFGIAGLVRSKKVGKGKVMSWFGIALSILWIAPVAYFVPHLLKASDAGCIAAKQTIGTYNDAKFKADETDPNALKADFQTVATQLTSAAAKSSNSAARTSIKSMAGDFQQLVDDLNSSTAPASDLQDHLNTDAAKVDSACGSIGN